VSPLELVQLFETKLSLIEFHAAVASATLRMVTSKAQKLNYAKSDRRRSFMTRLEEETAGCVAEMAWHKLLNLFFVPAINTFHITPDSLDDIEIRATTTSTNRLIVRDDDHRERRFVFAITDGESVRFVGWCYGYEAMKPQWLDNPNDQRESWFVPQDALRSMDTLTLDLLEEAV